MQKKHKKNMNSTDAKEVVKSGFSCTEKKPIILKSFKELEDYDFKLYSR